MNGNPVSAPSAIPSLATGHPARFRESISNVALRALSHQLEPAEIENEATAQIRKIQAAGINVSHVDTHKHTDLFPLFFMPFYAQQRPAEFEQSEIRWDRLARYSIDRLSL